MLFPRLLTKISTYVHDHCYLLFKINIQTHDVFRCSWILISKFLPGYSSRNLSSHGISVARSSKSSWNWGIICWHKCRSVSQLGEVFIRFALNCKVGFLPGVIPYENEVSEPSRFKKVIVVCTLDSCFILPPKCHFLVFS